MQVTLPPDLEMLVEKRLRSGAFSSAEEVFRDAVQIQGEGQTWTDEDRAALNRKLARSGEQLARGEVVVRQI